MSKPHFSLLPQIRRRGYDKDIQHTDSSSSTFASSCNFEGVGYVVGAITIIFKVEVWFHNLLCILFTKICHTNLNDLSSSVVFQNMKIYQWTQCGSTFLVFSWSTLVCIDLFEEEIDLGWNILYTFKFCISNCCTNFVNTLLTLQNWKCLKIVMLQHSAGDWGTWYLLVTTCNISILE